MQIYVDGHPVETTHFIQNDLLMVPALFFKYASISVDFHAENSATVLKYSHMVLTFLPGKKHVVCYVKGQEGWQRDVLDSIAIERNDGLYIPLKYVTEKFGMEVCYDARSSRTYIITNIARVSKPQLVYCGDTEDKRIALTFDDGPDDYYTGKILDILQTEGVEATFFVVGEQVRIFPEMLQRIVRGKHGLGNHSWTHPQFSKQTTSQVIREVQATEEEIFSLTGQRTGIFRAPYGAITDADLKVLDDLGFRPIMWSIDTLDWNGTAAEQILSTIMRDRSPGSIILQHCLKFKPGCLDETVKALPDIISQLRQDGYRFVTVQDLIR